MRVLPNTSFNRTRYGACFRGPLTRMLGDRCDE